MKINYRLSYRLANISLCYFVLEIALFIFTVTTAFYGWATSNKFGELSFVVQFVTAILISVIIILSKLVFITNNFLSTKLKPKLIFVFSSLAFYILSIISRRKKDKHYLLPYHYDYKKFIIFNCCWLGLLIFIIIINMWATNFFVTGTIYPGNISISIPYYVWWFVIQILHIIIFAISKKTDLKNKNDTNL